MNVIAEPKNGVLVVSLQGRLDSRTTGDFERAVMAHVTGPEGVHRVVMNLAGLDYISSIGLRVILVLAKKLSGLEGKLVLCDLKAHVLEVFTTSGFNQIIPITDSEADALKRF